MKSTFVSDADKPASVNLLIIAVAVTAFMMTFATFVLLVDFMQFVENNNYAFLAFLMIVIMLGGFAMGSLVKLIRIRTTSKERHKLQ